MWWLLFAILGFVLGEASGALAGAVFGGLIGRLLKQQDTLKARIEVLERRLQALAADATTAAPERPRAAAEVVAPEPEPGVGSGLEPGLEPASMPRTVIPAAAAIPVPASPPVAEFPVADMREAAPVRAAPPPDFKPGEWLARLLAGNLLAKLGMVLLFFGIASGLKLVAEHGMLPPALRLLLAGVAGLACIWAGLAPAGGGDFRPAWLLRGRAMSPSARAGFGFALEGGGFGILYLAVYFALARYGYLDATAAFALFAVLGVACLGLAAKQEGQSLALLGMLGAFLAPLLVPGRGEHLILFTYIVLLDAFILALSLHRAWRTLIVAGLGFSLLLGLLWADAHYQVALRGDVEVFVLVLFALFSLTPTLAARRGAPAQTGWQSAGLLFGPPTAAAAAQAALFDGEPATLALSGLVAGLWYGLLWFAGRAAADRLLRQTQAGLALAFLSLAPWLAFSENVAGVFWALEGAGLIGYAARQGGKLPLRAGILLQLLSGLLLFDLWLQGPDGQPFRNSLFHASVLLVAAGGFSAYALRGHSTAGRLFLAWTLLWWFGIWYWELGYLVNEPRRWVAMLLLAAVTGALLEGAGRRLAMTDARAAAALLLPALLAVLLNTYLEAGHPLAHGMWLALPVTLAVLYATLLRQERDALDWHAWHIEARHVLLFWAIAWVPAWEAHWLASTGELFGPGIGGALPEALRGALLALPLLLVERAGGRWPFGAHRPLYLRQGMALPALLAWLWLFSMPHESTGAWPLPYLPLLNPLELTALFLLWSLYRHWREAGMFWMHRGYPALFPLALLALITSGLARAVHHGQGVPFLADTLWHSDLLQALVSFAWTAFALAAMVLASRQRLRVAWFGGLALLMLVGCKLLIVDLANVSGLLRVLSLMGIGLLVLGAGYLAPVPPKAGEEPARADA